MGLFRKGKTRNVAKFHRADLVTFSHSREGKTLSYSRINAVWEYEMQIEKYIPQDHSLASFSKPEAARYPTAALQIRRGNRDNLGIISHITPYKHIL